MIKKLLKKWYGKVKRTTKPKGEWYDRLNVTPMSTRFAMDRGTPIDRVYIEKFLEEHADTIKGDVIEIAENSYTKKYGGADVKRSIILHVEGGKDCIRGNLETGEGIKEGMADCFICTQTIPFIYDVFAAAKNLMKALKPGGTALVTVGGVSAISRYDMDRWGHYWGVTKKSLRRIFEDLGAKVEIKSYGNVKSAVFFLYGLAAEEMDPEEIWFEDEDYPVTIAAKITKK